MCLNLVKHLGVVSVTVRDAAGLGRFLMAASALLWPAVSPAAPASACIAPISYLPLDAQVVGANAEGVAVLGGYERISPDGRFVLRSYSGGRLGQVSLIELPAIGAGPIVSHPTPLTNEAFPVQGTWRYLVDVNGEHYRFAEVLQKGRSAQPLFKGGMNGFYAVAAEMADPSATLAPTEQDGDTVLAPVAEAQDVYVRSLSWPQGASADTQGTGPLQLQTLHIRDDGRQARVVATSSRHFICSNRIATDGSVFALPMLSVDGRELSAIPQAPAQGQPSMRVYSLAADPMATNHPCQLKLDLGQTVSKSVFGFTDGGEPAWLTWSDVGSVYVYDRSQQQSFRLDRARDHVVASAFPGLTRDGRVIYAATWRTCPDRSSCPKKTGYVVVDPYQNSEYRAYWQAKGEPAPKRCITQQEVQEERTRFAAQHGL